jgi:hypothetical protein
MSAKLFRRLKTDQPADPADQVTPSARVTGLDNLSPLENFCFWQNAHGFMLKDHAGLSQGTIFQYNFFLWVYL